MTRAHLLHAMFHRQVDGDESLLLLAQERFRAADLGPEFYPDSPITLLRSMSFHPGQSSGTSTVHLPRHLDLFNPRSLDEIVAFARCCGPGVRGMIVHDQPDNEVSMEWDVTAGEPRSTGSRALTPGFLVNSGIRNLVTNQVVGGEPVRQCNSHPRDSRSVRQNSSNCVVALASLPSLSSVQRPDLTLLSRLKVIGVAWQQSEKDLMSLIVTFDPQVWAFGST